MHARQIPATSHASQRLELERRRAHRLSIGSRGVTLPSSSNPNLYVSTSPCAVRPSGSASREPGSGLSAASAGRTAMRRRSSLAAGVSFSGRKGARTHSLALPAVGSYHLHAERCTQGCVAAAAQHVSIRATRTTAEYLSFAALGAQSRRTDTGLRDLSAFAHRAHALLCIALFAGVPYLLTRRGPPCQAPRTGRGTRARPPGSCHRPTTRTG